MKATILVCCILVLVLFGLSCTSGTTLEISVAEIDNGVMIENVGNLACIVFVNSHEDGQRFELAVGENTTVTRITKPIEVSAVSVGNG